MLEPFLCFGVVAKIADRCMIKLGYSVCEGTWIIFLSELEVLSIVIVQGSVEDFNALIDFRECFDCKSLIS